jgi:hypothetical protein
MAGQSNDARLLSPLPSRYSLAVSNPLHNDLNLYPHRHLTTYLKYLTNNPTTPNSTLTTQNPNPRA